MFLPAHGVPGSDAFLYTVEGLLVVPVDLPYVEVIGHGCRSGGVLLIRHHFHQLQVVNLSCLDPPYLLLDLAPVPLQNDYVCSVAID